MNDETYVVISDPDLVRDFDTDDRARISLKLDELRNSKVKVAVKKLRDLEEEEEED